MSLARLKLLSGSGQVLHFPKGSGDDAGSARPERIDAMAYVARVLAQIPPPRKHLVRRQWRPGDVVTLSLPMPVRRLISHEGVAANAGRIALERGPIVYVVRLDFEVP